MSNTTEPTRPSDSELELLQLLWAEAPQAAADLAEKIRPQRDWSLNTVKTLLQRMAAKALVSVEVEGRRHLYRPLADARDIHPADLADLEALVRRLKK